MNIKICGLTNPKEAEYLNENKVNYAGMVLFFEKSKRNITIDTAKTIMAALSGDIKKVAVTVAPTVEQVKDICAAGFDIIQIHGSLPDDVYDAITIDIWKAFNIKDMDQYDSFAKKDKVKGFVFDSAEPGSGVAYDHKVLSGIDIEPDKLLVLAGGLDKSNVKDAIAQINPDVIDCSSGVEYGKEIVGKDPVKISEFVQEIRR